MVIAHQHRTCYSCLSLPDTQRIIEASAQRTLYFFFEESMRSIALNSYYQERPVALARWLPYFRQLLHFLHQSTIVCEEKS